LPIVDTDLRSLKANLRELIEDPPRRHALGEAGRRFVLEHHSYEAVGSVWEAIIEHVWNGVALPDELTAPDRC
jgi:glycosyltransferase involved in cell wall biosynthesis